MTSDVPSLKQQLSLLPKQLLKTIADLRLAILLLLAIALFSIIGTVIEQGQSVAYYQANYPEHPALFGFLSARVILACGFDRVYRTWWFLSLLVLFGSSLTACTFKRQLPALKAARRWKYYTKARQFEKLALSAELDRGSLDSLAPFLQQKNYKIFREGNALYARKGIVGRIGPIVVHASMLLVLIGSIIGAMAGFIAQEMVPSGESFRIQNIINAGPFAASQVPKDWGAVVHRFWIDYSAKGNIDQFYSDISVVDNAGVELKRETIHVNQPLRYRGVTLYQTSWGIAGAEVQVNNSPIFRLPMAQLDTQGNGQLWGTWVPIKPDLSAGISLLTRDLQGTLLVYNVKGELVGAVRAGSSIDVDGVTVKVHQLIGSTGLQIKADPGIPFVYAGFGFLMLGVAMSYFSHSQIWALQDGDRFYVGGRTNRAQVSFEREVFEILEAFNLKKGASSPDSSPEILSVKS